MKTRNHDAVAEIRVKQPTGDPRIDYPGKKRFVTVTYGGMLQADGTRTPLRFRVQDRWGEQPDIPCAHYPDCDRLRDELLEITPAVADAALAELLAEVGQ